MFHRLTVLTLIGSALLGFGDAAFAEATCSCMEGTIDEIARLCLPATVDGFQSVPVSDDRRAALKAYRNSLGGGYNVPVHRLAITVYFYDRSSPNEKDDADEMRAASVEILRSHKGTRVEMGGKGSLPLSGQSIGAHGGLFTWREGPNDYASFLWLIARELRWIKVRATYIRSLGDEVEAMKFATESVHKVVSQICSVQ